MNLNMNLVAKVYVQNQVNYWPEDWGCGREILSVVVSQKRKTVLVVSLANPCPVTAAIIFPVVVTAAVAATPEPVAASPQYP